MASDVDICNLALAHLGDEATVSSISPSDGSQQADYCVLFYPIARDQLLGMHAWSFATKRVTLALLNTSELPDTWQYCYAAPNGAIQVIAVLPPGNTDTFVATDPSNPLYGAPTQPGDLNTQPFIQETLQDGSKVIFTNVQDATARYIYGVTDTTKFPPLFVTALARLLAAYLAGPILKGEIGMKVAQAQYSIFVKVDGPLAMGMDQKGQRVNAYKNFIPDSLQSRR